MKEIVISHKIETTTKPYPKTEAECKEIFCENCLMKEFVLADGKCAHKIMLQKYFAPSFLKKFRWTRNQKKGMRHAIIKQNSTIIKKFLPESYTECSNLSCEKCIMNEYSGLFCSYRMMMNKYIK